MSRDEVSTMRSGEAETTSRVAPPPRVADAFRAGDGSLRGAGDGAGWSGLSGRTGVALAVGVLLVALVAFFAGRAYFHARGRAAELVMELHTRMNQKDWTGIYGDADSVYQAEMSRADSEALFAAINRKLGQVDGASQQTTNLAVTNSGSYLTAQFETRFAGDAHATETIVWRSLGGGYHLHSYNLRSLPLLTR